MDITPAISTDKQLIQAYGGGGFKVAEIHYDHPILVTPFRTVAWLVEAVSAIELESLSPLRQAEPPIELLLLGCGKSFHLPDAALRAALKDWGITVEPMDTGAACRTYNVLLAEERRVAAALIPVD